MSLSLSFNPHTNTYVYIYIYIYIPHMQTSHLSRADWLSCTSHMQTSHLSSCTGTLPAFCVFRDLYNTCSDLLLKKVEFVRLVCPPFLFTDLKNPVLRAPRIVCRSRLERQMIHRARPCTASTSSSPTPSSWSRTPSSTWRCSGIPRSTASAPSPRREDITIIVTTIIISIIVLIISISITIIVIVSPRPAGCLRAQPPRASNSSKF